MRKLLLAFVIVFSVTAYSQKYGNFFGGAEATGQWYLNDKELGIKHTKYPLRSNSYVFANYRYKNWTTGIQFELYEDKELLNYNPGYEDTNVATYYLQYKNDKIDVTAGYYYEQFGSGLLLRSWEDRALGINNALRGGRVIFNPFNFITIKGIYGRQRTGFKVSDSDIYGTDLELSVSNIAKFETTDLNLGFSYVGRDEITNIENPSFTSLTDAYAARINFTHNSFYVSAEYNYKAKDAIVQIPAQIENDFIKPGDALLFNIGYGAKGFGIDGTFRRMENMSFFSERDAKGNNFNDRIMNFIPSLTKQHHYNLSNIYVYQAQPSVFLSDVSLVKTGEIGGQLDLFYDFKKGTALGGKYGTKIALNASNWNALGGKFYIINPKDYETDYFGFGKKYFSDYNFEFNKKWDDKWHTIFAYINQYYNKKLVEGTPGLVKTNIVCAEATYKFTPVRSLRFLGEHMWADSDKKNWASATAEFNLNSKFSVYAFDMYNYGNDDEDIRHHYYNVGGSFRRNSLRVALSYGRQRGGLLCVGGVCRYVDEATAVTLSANITF